MKRAQLGAGTPVWEGGGWRELPPLTGKVTADVCVVGLGGSGLTAVEELLKQGVSVVGVDAGPVGAGAAGRNGGLLLAGLAAFHHDAVKGLGAERAAALYRLTERERDRLVAGGVGGARRTGSLRIANSEAELADCGAQFERMRADGLKVEEYAGPEGAGLLFPDDAVFNPLARCRELAEVAVRGGARLFENSPVKRVERGRVLTPAGEVSCQAVIVAVDGQLERLVPELEGSVRTARLQMLATEPTRELTVPRPVYRRWGYEYYQRTPSGRIALGGFRDVGGEGEWTHENQPTQLIQARLERYLKEELRVAARITHRWSALVGYSRGVLPVAREVSAGVVAIGAYNGTGNLVGGVLARAAARVALGLASAEWELFGGA